MVFGEISFPHLQHNLYERTCGRRITWRRMLSATKANKTYNLIRLYIEIEPLPVTHEYV